MPHGAITRRRWFLDPKRERVPENELEPSKSASTVWPSLVQVREKKKTNKGRGKNPCCRQTQHLARVSKQLDQQPPSYEKLLREELPPPAYHELEEVHTYWPCVHVEVIDAVDGNEIGVILCPTSPIAGLQQMLATSFHSSLLQKGMEVVKDLLLMQ